MKGKILIAGLFAIVCFGTFSSCTVTGPVGPIGNQGPTGASGVSFKGAIAGYVSLYDQYGNPVTVGLKGITLTLDSIENPIATVTTDTTGYYFFPNRFTGSYVLQVINSSSTPLIYGSVMKSFQFVSDTLMNYISLSEQANFAPTIVTSSTALGEDSLYINLAPDVQERDLMVFVGNNSSVNSNDYIYAFPVRVKANASIVTAVVSATTLYNVGFASGSTVYYAVYGAPVNDKSVYINSSTGQNIYTALSTSFITTYTLVP